MLLQQGPQVRMWRRQQRKVEAIVTQLSAGNYIFPPGQDGNMFSYYYDNWLSAWSSGHYLPAHMTSWPTERTLTLIPG
jgi:acyl-homoserine lactone acylase PvdQ